MAACRGAPDGTMKCLSTKEEEAFYESEGTAVWRKKGFEEFTVSRLGA